MMPFFDKAHYQTFDSFCKENVQLSSICALQRSVLSGIFAIFIGMLILATARKKRKNRENSYFDNDVSNGGFFDSGDFGGDGGGGD